jgi:hypothetical protein
MIDNHGYVFEPPSDEDGIAAVAGSFSGLHMDRGIEVITRRARTLAWRRRAVPATAAVAFAAAVGAVVVASPGHSPAPAAAVASPVAAASIQGSLQLTGFTVKKDTSTGIVTVTVKNFDDPTALIAALAKDGVKVQIYHQDNIPAGVVEKMGKMMGYQGDTYYTGVPWTKLSDGSYQIEINTKVLGPDRIQPLVIVKGY